VPLDEAVIVRMSVEGLGQKLIAAFMEHADNVKETVKEEVDHVLKTFDLRALVRAEAERQMHVVIREEVQRRYMTEKVRQRVHDLMMAIS
jgi:hypothetical protein